MENSAGEPLLVVRPSRRSGQDRQATQLRDAAANRLQVEISKLQQLSAAGAVAAVKAQVPAVGGACKNCHDKFRVPEKE